MYLRVRRIYTYTHCPSFRHDSVGRRFFMNKISNFFKIEKKYINIHSKCLRKSTNILWSFIWFKLTLFILLQEHAHKSGALLIWFNMMIALTLLPNKVERSGRSTFLADVIIDLGGDFNAAVPFAGSFQSILTLYNTTLHPCAVRQCSQATDWFIADRVTRSRSGQHRLLLHACSVRF